MSDLVGSRRRGEVGAGVIAGRAPKRVWSGSSERTAEESEPRLSATKIATTLNFLAWRSVARCGRSFSPTILSQANGIFC